uniref:Uncharacterized protein n=1 Tax=Arundo donax TaxID=35708 RepID=A0A0A8Z2U9_ARUDO
MLYIRVYTKVKGSNYLRIEHGTAY